MDSTKLTTRLGMAQAVLVTTADFLLHNPMDGGAWKQPTFYIGLIAAIVIALKAYFTQGIAPAGQVIATVPVGTVAASIAAPPDTAAK